MKFQFLILSFFIVLSACGDQTTNTSSTTAQTANVTAPSNTATTPKTKTQTAVAKKPSLSNQGLIMNLTSSDAKSGEEVCVDFSVKDFAQVVSMQYSINWDAEVLKYKSLKGFNLKDLSAANFGINRVKEGKMTFSWYDQAVRGISVDNNTDIYQLCFDAVGKKGSKSKVLISEDPIIVEITGVNQKFLKFFPKTAHVKIK